MTWAQICHDYSNCWVIVEARTWTEAPDGRRLTFWLIAVHPYERPLLQQYLRLTHQNRQRDYYLAHTTSPTLQLHA